MCDYSLHLVASRPAKVGAWLVWTYCGRVHNRLAKIPSQIGHNKTQQDQGDKTPKYPSPRLMTAAIDGRFFGFFAH